MSTKLTLSIKEQIIQDAKLYAKEHGKSLSNLVEEYLKSLTTSEQKTRQEQLPLIIRELRGSVKLPADFKSYKDTLEEALLEKYLQ